MNGEEVGLEGKGVVDKMWHVAQIHLEPFIWQDESAAAALRKGKVHKGSERRRGQGGGGGEQQQGGTFKIMWEGAAADGGQREAPSK